MGRKACLWQVSYCQLVSFSTPGGGGREVCVCVWGVGVCGGGVKQVWPQHYIPSPSLSLSLSLFQHAVCNLYIGFFASQVHND